MRKKIRQKSYLAIMNKSRTYIDNHIKPYLCTKFGDSSLKNEAEPPWSNLSDILG